MQLGTNKGSELQSLLLGEAWKVILIIAMIHSCYVLLNVSIECLKLNGCQRGNCEITLGFGLPAQYVLHTVDPRDKDGDILKSFCSERQ